MSIVYVPEDGKVAVAPPSSSQRSGAVSPAPEHPPLLGRPRIPGLCRVSPAQVPNELCRKFLLHIQSRVLEHQELGDPFAVIVTDDIRLFTRNDTLPEGNQ
ncbi:hypothetical protein [Nonomuraea sp. NPDC049784]|uniref:hypothetical protein n=1 Tax=Nonomuraea sp. NPDC049784 TaxID=3154361 RepID=UPI0033D0411F